MPTPVNNVTRMQRRNLLKKLDAFASDFLTDIDNRRGSKYDFWCYMNFCSPMVIDLVAWERIHTVDLEELPAVKQLFMEATRGAHRSLRNKGRYDPEIDRGRGRRTFHDIGEAELAGNILPRLEHVLYCWGITYDSIEDKFSERAHTPAELEQLTEYYGEI